MRMNLQSLWQHVPLSGKLALFWERITSSRITTIYFIFSVLHFVIQFSLQIHAFVTNAQAASFLTELVTLGNATQSGFTVYDGVLRMCETAPSSMNADSCEVLWSPSPGNSSSDAMRDAVLSSMSSSSATSSLISSIASSSSVVASLSSSLTSSSVLSSAYASSSNASVSAASSSVKPTVTTSSTSHYTSVASTLTSKKTDDDLVSSVIVATTSFSTHFVTVTLSATPVAAAVRPESEPTFVDITVFQLDKRSPTVKSVDNGNEVQVTGVQGLGDVTINHECLTVLNWPISQLDNTKREDITFIMFQFWLLGMSLVALLNESIPHIAASLLTHIGGTAWGGFQIYDTAQFHDNFKSLTIDGACGINLLPTYWQERASAEIPSLVLNAVALIVSAVLSWRLIRTFGWQTFKRVGACRTINRIYNVVLLLSIAIQVALFFIAVTAGLWLDQLINGYIGMLTSHATLFKVIVICVLVFLVPWLSMGWIAVRRERRLMMLAFLSVAVLYTVGWVSMFAASTFRWTFTQWRFFSIMASASVLLAVVTLSLGIVCRLNFGKGLPRYLNAQEPIPEKDFIIESKPDVDIEKAVFPSDELPIPTYLAAYESRSPSIISSDESFNAGQLGPRFNSSIPFEPQPPVYGAGSNNSSSSHTAVSDTPSVKRTSSAGSYMSTVQLKRWVIE